MLKSSLNREAAVGSGFDECYNRIFVALTCGDVNGRCSIVSWLMRLGAKLNKRTRDLKEMKLFGGHTFDAFKTLPREEQIKIIPSMTDDRILRLEELATGSAERSKQLKEAHLQQQAAGMSKEDAKAAKLKEKEDAKAAKEAEKQVGQSGPSNAVDFLPRALSSSLVALASDFLDA